MIDAHHHVWDLGVRPQEWIDPGTMGPILRDFPVTELLPQAAAAGVDRTILVQTVTVPEETPELLAIAERTELVAGVVGWVDLTAPDMAERLAAVHGPLLKGIRHQVQGEPDPDWLGRADVRNGLRAVAAAGLVYELLVLPHQVPAAIEVTRALPELTFVLDHLGKPPIASGGFEPWAARIRVLAQAPNVYAKLSGLVTEAGTADRATIQPYASHAIEVFGPDRLLFGSDWPVCLLAADYPRVVELTGQLLAGLGPAERERVWTGTAAHVYRIGA
ncbi:amidohydrolase family protein [Sciscionella sediminilitoris]|uniref:amidohydrolase family protein n=1 Tax=Sciscionella sediminilitoris TaxID=1445613 RepID=UPI0004DFAC8A|nr:amidohydrolase family protein [Sciscionella sp. SE31]